MSYQKNDLFKLVLRAQSNDRTAVSNVMEASREIVNPVINMYFKNYDDQKDVTQDFLVHKLLSGINKFEPSRGNFESWIKKMASCYCIDVLRKRKTEKNFWSAESLNTEWESRLRYIPSEETNEEFYANKSKMLNSAMAMLNQRKRNILVLFYQENLSYKEIAGKLGSTTGSIGVEMQRAKEELKKNLQNIGYEKASCFEI
ncbi:MAG: hypothetical protein A2275_07465 [Bacteroidetes bacterium RIFOXYA12_FULL_35_11]|nr:MAG: hypothetical protein A2X01_04295 [Bacteroidetes bacterium GWF2_35_48]OFY73127.1 MAG: hypothetical protein A2275_07465 [Bacteroidetes bacterium RIFOXYA12_FULL_35_11]HBX51571.1 hypothetical protein [Bacteroidales bacterium]